MPDFPVRLSIADSDLESGGGFLQQFSVKETYRMHSHDFYEFFMVSRGRAIHCINGTSQLLTEGCFVLIRPNDVHKYEFFNQYDFELITVSFQPEAFEASCALSGFLPACFTVPFLPPHIILDGYHFSDVKRKLLHLEKKEKGRQRKMYLHSLLPFFLYCFIEAPGAAPPDDYIPAWLISLVQQMDQAENFVPGLSRLIELANMSQEHLTREFRKHLNITPTEFINAKRMNLAIKLLLESGLEIIDICHECGFNSLSHFYRIFSKQYECSPKKFLERYHDHP